MSTHQQMNPSSVYPSVSPSPPCAVTWSTITDSGGDEQCSPYINNALNNLTVSESIAYSKNGYTYTTKKIDPYTANETNDSTKQQRTLKSSVSIDSCVFCFVLFFFFLVFFAFIY